jgi:methyl-accepting chemotaxis protein
MDPARARPVAPSAPSTGAAPSPAAAPEASGASPAAGPADTPRRLLRNYLLDSALQLRLASYLLAVAAILSSGLGWLLWTAYRETSRVVALGDTVAGESLAQALAAEDRGRIGLVAVALAAALLGLLVAAVVVTHRIAGPALVLRRVCRDVAAGRLAPARPLRARDLLVDLAADVGEMIEALRAREGRERDELARAAACLGDPSSPPDARAAALAAIEALAAEKDARLGS